MPSGWRFLNELLSSGEEEKTRTSFFFFDIRYFFPFILFIFLWMKMMISTFIGVFAFARELWQIRKYYKERKRIEKSNTY